MHHWTPGLDAVFDIWEEGNRTANNGILTVVLSTVELFNAAEEGAIRPDSRYTGEQALVTWQGDSMHPCPVASR